MGQMDGKVAIVTGSGRGIGREIALRLVRDGARVVINDIDEAPAKETIAEIEKMGGKAVACNGDVAKPDFGDRIVKTAVDAFGDCHVVVNNAGYTWDSVVQKMTDEQWYATLDVHLTAPFRVLRAFQQLVRGGRGGREARFDGGLRLAHVCLRGAAMPSHHREPRDPDHHGAREGAGGDAVALDELAQAVRQGRRASQHRPPGEVTLEIGGELTHARIALAAVDVGGLARDPAEIAAHARGLLAAPAAVGAHRTDGHAAQALAHAGRKGVLKVLIEVTRDA